MSAAQLALELLHQTPAGLAFDDAAVHRLVALVRPLEGDELIAAGHDLLRLAHFLDVERASPAGSNTLITLVLALAPALLAAGVARADALTTAAADASARLSSFRGDARVPRVLESGARPPGTTAAGPLARFNVDKK